MVQAVEILPWGSQKWVYPAYLIACLVMERPRASAIMELTYLAWNFPVSTAERLIML